MKIIYQSYYLFFFIASWVASLFSNKIRQGLWGRRELVKRLQRYVSSQTTDQPKIWFHVASAGEFEQAIPLMEELRKRSSALIILTYFSPSGALAVEMEATRRDQASLPLCWDYADFSPHDFSNCVTEFLATLKPQALILIHKEIWPNLVLAARRQGVPCFLWLARFSRHIPWFIRPLLSYFTDIGVVDSSSFDVVKQFAPSLPVRKIGDTRLERILFRKKYFSHSDLQQRLQLKSAQDTVIAASFWDEDFDVLMRSLPILLRSNILFSLILVPHEPIQSRLTHWRETIPEELQKAFSIQILSQMGILAELYSQASIAIVGGSFKNRVHNVLEPLAYQSMIVTGPRISHSVEASELFNQGILQKVENEHELAKCLARLLTDHKTMDGLRDKINKYLAGHAACSQAYLKTLKKY